MLSSSGWSLTDLEEANLSQFLNMNGTNMAPTLTVCNQSEANSSIEYFNDNDETVLQGETQYKHAE